MFRSLFTAALGGPILVAALTLAARHRVFVSGQGALVNRITVFGARSASKPSGPMPTAR